MIKREEMEDVAKLADDLMGCFLWHETPQGHEYWSSVFDELARLIDERKKFDKKNTCKHCGCSSEEDNEDYDDDD